MREWIRADFERQRMTHPVLARLTFGEHNRTRRYLSMLRHVEYWRGKRRRLWDWLPLALWTLRLRRYSLKTGMYILPGTCGPGLLLPHPGFIRVDALVRMGRGCTILPMVLFGKKKPDSVGRIIVGDNCYFGVGSTVLGPVRIGNNVTVAAGAVVTADVDDNTVVAGVPARPVKKLNNVIGGGKTVGSIFSYSAA